MSYDAFLITLAMIGALSALFFFLALIADLAWPWLESRPWRVKRQATYRRERS